MTEFCEEYMDVIEKSRIFGMIPKDRYENVCRCLKAERCSYAAGEEISGSVDGKHRAGLLLEGRIEEFLYDEDGNKFTLSILEAGDIFGAEDACFAQLSEQICLRAVTDLVILSMDFGALLSEATLSCPHRLQMTANLMQEFARQIQFFNQKIHILSQKKLRDKISLYLGTLPMSEDGEIDIPMNRGQLAEYLYVDRSALSRELCRLRDEHIIDMDRNHIRINDRDYIKKI